MNTVRLTFVYAGKNWIDTIEVWHHDKLIASMGFGNKDGYENGKTTVGRPSIEGE